MKLVFSGGKRSSTSNTNANKDPLRAFKQEFDSYLKDDLIDEKMCPLNWWKTNQKIFPNLTKLAKIFLAVPASQSTSERIFSSSGNVVTAKRSCLLPEHVNHLCFLHDNLK